jgi:hypothetical protein
LWQLYLTIVKCFHLKHEFLHMLGNCTQNLKNHMFNNLYFFWVQKKAFKTFKWVLNDSSHLSKNQKWGYTILNASYNSNCGKNVTQPLILRPPLNIRVWHLPQIFKSVLNHITFHPMLKFQACAHMLFVWHSNAKWSTPLFKFVIWISSKLFHIYLPQD